MTQKKLNEIRLEWLKFRSSLYDSITDIPTINLVIEDVRKFLDDACVVGVLYIYFEGSEEVEEKFGFEVFDDILRIISNSIKTRINDFDKKIMLTRMFPRGDAFIFFVQGAGEEDLKKIGFYFRTNLLEALKTKFGSKIAYALEPRFGYSTILKHPILRIERSIERALTESIKKSENPFRHKRNFMKIRELIEKEAIEMYYQPIVLLKGRKIFAFEALARGTLPTFYRSPTLLFQIARESATLLELERLAIRKAIQNAVGIGSARLFLNATSIFMQNMLKEMKYIEGWLSMSGLNPERITFEITEKSAITNMEFFREVIKNMKNEGFKLAIDDVGTGYSSLEVLSQLEPDYLKYDRSLIINIDRSKIKRALLKSLQAFADGIDAEIIVEGVEKREELAVLEDLGIKFVQGFIFAKPAPSFVDTITEI